MSTKRVPGKKAGVAVAAVLRSVDPAVAAVLAAAVAEGDSRG
jgi:hypothetical protein